jgi:hypothetical protein
MRFRTHIAPFLSLVACAAILAAGCHATGDGIGSAPPESDPCPPTLASVTEGAPCNGSASTAPRVCCYVDAPDGGADAGGDAGAGARVNVACGAAGTGATVAYCAGGASADGGPATWDLQIAGDAGVSDTGADAGDAADASETGDAADASETGDAADASETSDAADASETSDAADASDVADADEAG